ncbi:MAG TPA: ParB/RepB/Spo0J family partition protein [Methylomirabilota bacterium]|nr:ParB/RepB/Spo0J family partition protein [Methylomirabilota bacterium]
MASRHGLGRGLGALLTTPLSLEGKLLHDLPVDAISPNPQQPRKDFNVNSLNDLSESVKRSGILQPVIVRKVGLGYELVVGERRWRAAKMAGLDKIPAVVRDVSDKESIELALVENLLREDLNPIEEADAYRKLLADFGWTQEELAQHVGKDRSSIANYLRLLRLPEVIQTDLRSGRLTMGHARALLALSSPQDQLKLREEILIHSWSVRATEEDVQRKRSQLPRRAVRRSPELVGLEETLRDTLATRVRIVGNEQRGRIEVIYSSREELERLTELIAPSRV